MNVLVDWSGTNAAVPIDFQWTGLGYGMADVALHLYHSVSLDCMTNGGEEELLRYYHRELLGHLNPELTTRYTFEVASRQYRLCVLDYARMVMSSFFANKTPATCEAWAGELTAPSATIGPDLYKH
jgi:hypothetical protein